MWGGTFYCPKTAFLHRVIYFTIAKSLGLVYNDAKFKCKKEVIYA
jgi:hypothetical protein